MANEIGVSVVTVNSLVKELVKENIFIEGSSIKQKTGRPAAEYCFNYEKILFLLLSIQEEKSMNKKRKLEIHVKITDMEGNEKHSEIIGFSSITMITLTNIIEQYINSYPKIGRIGLSIPGKISKGIITSSWNNYFNNWNIEKELKEITKIPIKIQNDAHLMTMGFCIEHDLDIKDGVVGIYYPEKSMPGITIFTNNAILEGQSGLAGEAKYLPLLMDKAAPNTKAELAVNLSEIIPIYNAVLAPSTFILSSNDISEEAIYRALESNPHLALQPHKPVIYFDQNFQQSLTTGLRWLVTEDTVYRMQEREILET